MLIKDIYNYLVDLIREAPITEKEEAEDGEAIKEVLEELHQAEVIEALISTYIKTRKAQLFEIYKAREEDTRTEHTYGSTTVKYVADGITQRFDTAKFKKDHPEVAKEYTKEIARAGHVEVSYDE